MIISGIYSITQLSTGKRYIGSSININIRWTSHRSALNRNVSFNTHLQNAWNKNGYEDFLFEVIEGNILEEIRYWGIKEEKVFYDIISNNF